MSTTSIPTKGSRVRRKADGLIGEVYAVDRGRGVTTVRWKAGRRNQTLVCTSEQLSEYWDVIRLGRRRGSLKLLLAAGVVIFVVIVWINSPSGSGPSPSQNLTSASAKGVVASDDSNPTPPSKVESSSLDSPPKVDVVAEQDGAVICPDAKAFDAFDTAAIQALSTNPPSDSASKPDLAAIWLHMAKPNGCNYVRPGTPLVAEGEAGSSGGSGPLAMVTARMPDGTTIGGVASSNMLYRIPKGNVVAGDIGAIICPAPNAIIAYKNAETAWVESHEPRMSAEDFRAAAKTSVEGLAKSAGCDYVLPGTPLVSEGGTEGGNGYGANLNIIVTAKLTNGTTVTGLTLPVMIAQNQQQNAEETAPSAAQPETPQKPDDESKAFTDCLLSKAQNSQYSSFDGGKSAMQLLGDCPDQWKDYVDACMRSGNTDGDCTLKSGILAQAALKSLNK